MQESGVAEYSTIKNKVLLNAVNDISGFYKQKSHKSNSDLYDKTWPTVKSFTINFQSVWNKTEKLANLFKMKETDLLLASESWLKSNVNINELSIADKYEIYRKDR